MSKYPFESIEPKWQKYWDEKKTFKVTEDEKFPKDKRLLQQDYTQDILKATLQQIFTAATFV